MVPPEFVKVLKTFLADLKSTFPEIELTPELAHIRDVEVPAEPQCAAVYDYAKTTFPNHLFDILGQNNELFAKDVFFLPGINFRLLWNENISEKTKETIWNYLKLMVLLLVGGGGMFGDLKDEGLKTKLDEAAKNIHSFFSGAETEEPVNAENLKDNLEGLMGGKLGALAKEIAAETMGEATPEKLQSMMRDPTKMMGLVSSVGEKLDKKLKSGDIKESEMLEEAADMLKKLQDMPGMGGFKEMFKKFAGGGKMDMSGMQAKVSQNLKRAKTKERLQKKLQERQPLEKAVFSTGETVEKSTAAQKKKRKKNKKPKSIDAPILDA
jgi:hypothetical protein